MLNADQHFGHRRFSSQILALQSLPRSIGLAAVGSGGTVLGADRDNFRDTGSDRSSRRGGAPHSLFPHPLASPRSGNSDSRGCGFSFVATDAFAQHAVTSLEMDPGCEECHKPGRYMVSIAKALPSGGPRRTPERSWKSWSSVDLHSVRRSLSPAVRAMNSISAGVSTSRHRTHRTAEQG